MLLASTCLGIGTAHAVDSTWGGGDAGSPNEWVDSVNWNNGIPDGAATFDNTAVTTTVANDNGIVVINTVNFASNASAFTINVYNPFLVNGAGIQNASANVQSFNVNDTLIFNNLSTVAASVDIRRSILAQSRCDRLLGYSADDAACAVPRHLRHGHRKTIYAYDAGLCGSGL